MSPRHNDGSHSLNQPLGSVQLAGGVRPLNGAVLGSVARPQPIRVARHIASGSSVGAPGMAEGPGRADHRDVQSRTITHRRAPGLPAGWQCPFGGVVTLEGYGRPRCQRETRSGLPWSRWFGATRASEVRDARRWMEEAVVQALGSSPSAATAVFGAMATSLRMTTERMAASTEPALPRRRPLTNRPSSVRRPTAVALCLLPRGGWAWVHWGGPVGLQGSHGVRRARGRRRRGGPRVECSSPGDHPTRPGREPVV